MFQDEVQQVLTMAGQLSAKQPEALKLINKVYKDMFGEAIKKQCGDCITKAFLRIQKFVYLQTQNNSNFNLKEMKKHSDKAFVLKKGKTLDLGFTGDTITDLSSDLQVAKVLSRHPNLVKYFDKFPINEAGELDLSGFDLDSTEEEVFVSVADPNAPPVPQNFTPQTTPEVLNNETQQNTAPVSKTSAKTPVAEVPKIETSVVKLPVAKTTTALESASKPAPHKAQANRIPNEGETIEDAAIRFGVSGRTIERDMKAAKIDVKAWKEKTAPVVKDEKEGAEVEKTKVVTEDQENKENATSEGASTGKREIIVDEAFYNENKEDCDASDIKIGDTIEIDEEESAEEQNQG